MSPAVMPEPVRPLSWFSTSATRFRLFLARHEQAILPMAGIIILLVVVVAMLINEWRMASGAVIIGVGLLLLTSDVKDSDSDAYPLDSFDLDQIAETLDDHPEWAPMVAEWMAQGPLENRHLRSIEKAKKLIEKTAAAPQQQQHTEAYRRLRAVNQGQLGSMVDQMTADRDLASLESVVPQGPPESSGKTNRI